MDQWDLFLGVLVLLTTALVLGAMCERLRQSAILGYLLAGTLLGPNALNLINDSHLVEMLAELGVAVLLFTIGLEFSFQRLRRLGAVALAGGSLQVLITGTVGAAAAMLFFGRELKPAVAIGAMLALSSTACVLRLLISRAEIDSIHGRTALGILLLQDLAVVPLVLLFSALGGEGSVANIVKTMGWTILMGALMVGGFYVLFNYVVPHVLNTHTMRRNRELPVLLAVVVGLGSTWAAHSLGISPAIGAFIAGMLLAASPFSTQIRADVSSLRTLLMTLFFVSVGMLSDPKWFVGHWWIVLVVVAGIIFIKAGIIWMLLRRFGLPHGSALASGLCLAQVGEFSFVLATSAHQTNVIVEDTFLLFVSATIVTLFVTPYLVATAPTLSGRIVARLARMGLLTAAAPFKRDEATEHRKHVLIVGFGPAGQAVGQSMVRRGWNVTVADLNPGAIALARQLGFDGHLADASHPDVLEHLHVDSAVVVVITIPDPVACRQIIQNVRTMAETAQIIARARYHVYRWELQFSGAHVVVDEEEQVGRRMALELKRLLREDHEEDTEAEAAT